MAPVTKKRKIAPTKYLCHGHDRERAESTFPDYNPSPECNHLINYCKDCLKAWTKAQVEGNLFKTAEVEGDKVFGIQCPQCPAIMRSANVEIATDVKKVLKQFEDAERKHVIDNTPGWRWCLAPDCKAGQVHERRDKQQEAQGLKSKGEEKATTIKDDPDIFTCNECGARACVPCDRPWHEGESCTDYQARVKDRIEEEDKSIAEIKKVTKKCPHCHASIQKNGGCPAMSCSSCKSPFCWDCTAAPCRCGQPQA